jgi:hypothetical protein
MSCYELRFQGSKERTKVWAVEDRCYIGCMTYDDLLDGNIRDIYSLHLVARLWPSPVRELDHWSKLLLILNG